MWSLCFGCRLLFCLWSVLVEKIVFLTKKKQLSPLNAISNVFLIPLWPAAGGRTARS